MSTYESPTVQTLSAGYLASVASYMESGGYTPPDPQPPAPSEADVFKQKLQDHFGFTSYEAGLIYRCYTGVVALCSGLSENRELRTAWAFFRVLGAFSYNDVEKPPRYDESDAIERAKNCTAWNANAGDVGQVYSGWGNGSSGDEQGFFTNAVGFSVSEYKKLRYAVRLQHQMCCRTPEEFDGKLDEIKSPYLNAEPDGHNGYLFEYCQAMGYDESQSVWGNYQDYVDGVKLRFCVMPDFAHLCITVAAALAGDLDLDGPANLVVTSQYPALLPLFGDNIRTLREALAGWLGDAALVEEPGGKAYFAYDDFWADVDAMDFVALLRTGQYNCVQWFITIYSRQDDLSSYDTFTGAPSGSRGFARTPHFIQHFTALKAAESVAFLAGMEFTSYEALVAELQGGNTRKDAGGFLKLLAEAVDERGYRASDKRFDPTQS